jgi:hypothetical protein
MEKPEEVDSEKSALNVSISRLLSGEAEGETISYGLEQWKAKQQ